MSEHDAQMTARNLFLSRENIAHINSRLKIKGNEKVRRSMLADWYDSYMCSKKLSSTYIENVITWQQFMTENYIRGYLGYHSVSGEDIPYLPYQDYSAGLAKDDGLIEQTRADCKFPKFNIISGVGERRDFNGNIQIDNNAYKPIRMMYPAKPWRFGKQIPTYQVQQSANGSKLIDKSYRGSLYDWEILHRPHTKRDMTIFMTNNVKQR